MFTSKSFFVNNVNVNSNINNVYQNEVENVRKYVHIKRAGKTILIPNSCKTKWVIYVRLGTWSLILGYFNEWLDFSLNMNNKTSAVLILVFTVI